MSLILEMPRELRDKILTLVVLSTIVSPPESPEYTTDKQDREQQCDDTSCLSWYNSQGVRYQKDTRMKGIPTLQVNRQLRNETLAVINHLKLPGLRSYKLDVMLVNESELWPTWLYVPTSTTRVEEVHATFRIIGPSKKRRSGFSGGDGGPPLSMYKSSPSHSYLANVRRIRHLLS